MSEDTFQFMNLHQLEAYPREERPETTEVIYWNDNDTLGRLRQP